MHSGPNVMMRPCPGSYTSSFQALALRNSELPLITEGTMAYQINDQIFIPWPDRRSSAVSNTMQYRAHGNGCDCIGISHYLPPQIAVRLNTRKPDCHSCQARTLENASVGFPSALTMQEWHGEVGLAGGYYTHRQAWCYDTQGEMEENDGPAPFEASITVIPTICREPAHGG